ncbi:hypothetical protein V6N12_043080 [Hibiscus sabdariffa]|uniref:Uncharacterized protein n=1 Tax=Hibiscus sabdariffa TaxID=183260 RepID=A0ABR2DJ62_9ROSI
MRPAVSKSIPWISGERKTIEEARKPSGPVQRQLSHLTPVHDLGLGPLLGWDSLRGWIPNSFIFPLRNRAEESFNGHRSLKRQLPPFR